MATIAFIGLGQMGAPMASNLIKQGHQLHVFDISQAAVQTLVQQDTHTAPRAPPMQQKRQN